MHKLIQDFFSPNSVVCSRYTELPQRQRISQPIRALSIFDVFVLVNIHMPVYTQTASHVAFSINLQKTPSILKLEMEVKNLCLVLSPVRMGFCFVLTFNFDLKMSVPWVGKIPWRRAWQPPAVFLPGESQRQRSLEGYSPQGRRTDLDMTEATQPTEMSLTLRLKDSFVAFNVFSSQNVTVEGNAPQIAFKSTTPH